MLLNTSWRRVSRLRPHTHTLPGAPLLLTFSFTPQPFVFPPFPPNLGGRMMRCQGDFTSCGCSVCSIFSAKTTPFAFFEYFEMMHFAPSLSLFSPFCLFAFCLSGMDHAKQSRQLVSNWEFVDEDEAAMAEYVATKGPISIAVDAQRWSFYNGGIMSSSSICPAVLLSPLLFLFFPPPPLCREPLPPPPPFFCVCVRLFGCGQPSFSMDVPSPFPFPSPPPLPPVHSCCFSLIAE